MRITISTVLTISRIAVIPLMVLIYYMPGLETVNRNLLSGFLFVYASITDGLDGYIARKWNQVSPLGTMLDPIADKLVVTTALVILMKAGIADLIPSLIIICREILVSGLREFLANLKGTKLPVTKLAKWKTAIQMVAICCLLFQDGLLTFDLTVIGEVMLYLAAGLTIVTGVDYMYAVLREME
ncbi:MAG: CDP-diacylglycerol--glycerol-3-phosphate 3-phosphatidyltransferase [Nitrospirae bacterium]|nr:MAG: CDP-diacylglycerol--glycerol-3-phosphate 3-phosphatidyltransferase [Nitrospirota bacterium]